MFFEEHFLPVPRFDALMRNGDTYRRERVYVKEVSDVFAAHETMCRALHQTYSLTTHVEGTKRIVRPSDRQPVMMSLTGWIRLLSDIKFLDEDCTRREATLVFKWSRMASFDAFSSSGFIASTHLTFPDFLEALARLSEVKTLPVETDLPDDEFFRLVTRSKGAGRRHKLERRDSTE